MYVLDASVWVSRFLISDVHHEASHGCLARLIDRGQALVSPALLLPEIAGALSRQSGRPALARRAVSLLQRLPGMRLVPVRAELAQQAALLAGELRLRGADAVYVSLAKRLGIPLVTWDREQQQRGATVITVESPSIFLR